MSRPERQLEPHRSALDRFGFELRRLRKARGLSQGRLGLLVHVSGDLIQRIEVGARRPSRDLAEHCDAALRANGMLIASWNALQAERLGSSHLVVTDNADTVSDKPPHVADKRAESASELPEPARMIRPAVGVSDGMLLALSVPFEEGRHSDGFSAADRDIVPCRTEDGRIIWVSVPRRDFILGGTGFAASIVSGSALGHGKSTAKLMAKIRSGEGSPFDRFESMRKVLMECDNLFGPKQVIQLAHDQLVMLDGLRKNTRGRDNSRLLDIEVQFADLLSWLYQDSGNHHNAQYWLSRALDLTHIAGDAGTVAFVLARKSQLAGQFDDGAEAVEVAEAARREVSAKTRSAVVAATYSAHGYALCREKTSSLRAYDQAHQLLRDAELEEVTWYGQFLSPAYIEIQRAHSLTIFEEYDQAAKSFQTAIDTLPNSYYRDRGVYLARKALAHAAAMTAAQGDKEEHAVMAGRSGLEALAIGVETHSGRIQSELAQLERRLEGRHGLPAVNEFKDALNSVRSITAGRESTSHADRE